CSSPVSSRPLYRLPMRCRQSPVQAMLTAEINAARAASGSPAQPLAVTDRLCHAASSTTLTDGTHSAKTNPPRTPWAELNDADRPRNAVRTESTSGSLYQKHDRKMVGFGPWL